MRHGPTQWNLEHRYNSRTDISLVLGESPNLAMHASVIKKFDVKRIISSPAKRAVETANFVREVQEFLPNRCNVWPELHEVDFGNFEGNTKIELKKSDLAPQYENWMNSDKTAAIPPSGESWDSVLSRINATFQRVQSLDENLILVSHGYFIRCLVSFAVGVRPSKGVRMISTENYGLFRLKFSAGSKPKLASPLIV
ncbi:hypothetical protein C1J03_07290 [Sulfitobacter sp. SK012]|nr:hypothetical protein C1J03_07290 [Sulfitobacter sp. SK012]